MSLNHLTDEQLINYYNNYKQEVDKSKRFENIKINFFDVKFAYHIVRLLSQCEQILTEGDLVLDDKSRGEHMKAIRRGEVKQEEIVEWFHEKEKTVEKFYRESKLQHSPDENKIKKLLFKCLEEHYGSLDKVVYQEEKHEAAIKEIQAIVGRF